MTIELVGLVVFGHHGYLEEERRLGQRFLVDLWVEVEESATASDRIDETVDYRRLAGLVREVFSGPERLLLEGLAGAIADGILSRFAAVERVRVDDKHLDGIVVDQTPIGDGSKVVNVGATVTIDVGTFDQGNANGGGTGEGGNGNRAGDGGDGGASPALPSEALFPRAI